MSHRKTNGIKDACYEELHHIDRIIRDCSDKLSGMPDDDPALENIRNALAAACRELNNIT